MRAILTMVAAAVLLPATAGAQPAVVPLAEVTAGTRAPAPAPGGAITLTEAVQLAVRLTPSVATAAESLRRDTGGLQSARGIFDALFRVAPSIGYERNPVAPYLLERERDKREQITAIRDSFRRSYQTLNALIEGTSTAPPECPSGLTTEIDGVSLERKDPVEVSLVGIDSDLPPLRFEIEGVPVATFSVIDDLCSTQLGGEFNPESLESLYRRIDAAGDYSLDGLLSRTDAAADGIRRLQREVIEAVAARAALSVVRLGGVPDTLEKITAAIQVSYDKPFRSGLAFGIDLNLSSSENNFVDKLKDPAFGNVGVPTKFPSSVSGTLFVPLGRGRGAAGNAAEERAAEATVAARREQLRHEVAREAFRASLSYINVVAAQQRLHLLEQSLERQRRFVTLTDERVQAGEVPGIDADRSQARAASVAGSIASARQTLHEARVGLAETLGLDPQSIDQVPTAGGTFVDALPAIPAAGGLLGGFRGLRRDVRSLEHARAASAALVVGSQADLRRRFDVSITGGMSNLYESPFYYYYEDERYPIVAQIEPNPTDVDTPVRAWWPSGWWRSLTGRWEPFVTAKLTVDLPFGNNIAKGRLLQARAGLQRTEIQQIELGRTTGENLVSLTGSLQHAAEAVERSRVTVQQFEAALEGTMASFDAAESTLLDALLTEEDVTRARLDLVREQQIFASTYVRMKYEAGDLVAFDQEGTAAEAVRFDPLPVVTR